MVLRRSERALIANALSTRTSARAGFITFIFSPPFFLIVSLHVMEKSLFAMNASMLRVKRVEM